MNPELAVLGVTPETTFTGGWFGWGMAVACFVKIAGNFCLLCMAIFAPELGLLALCHCLMYSPKAGIEGHPVMPLRRRKQGERK